MFTRIIASFALASMCMSCSPKYVKPAAADPQSDADANVEFALSFLKKTNQTVASDENLVVSPYSAGVALSMLEEGAEGQTKAEFDNVLYGRLYPAENLGGGDVPPSVFHLSQPAVPYPLPPRQRHRTRSLIACLRSVSTP